MYLHLLRNTWCLSPSPDYYFQSGYQKYLLKSCSVFNSLSWERLVYIYSGIWDSANFSLRFSNFTVFFSTRNGILDHFQEIVFECFSCRRYRCVWSRFSRCVQLSFFVWSLSERFSRPVWKNLSVRDFCDPFCRPRFFLCVRSSVVSYRSGVDQNSSFYRRRSVVVSCIESPIMSRIIRIRFCTLLILRLSEIWHLSRMYCVSLCDKNSLET